MAPQQAWLETAADEAAGQWTATAAGRWDLRGAGRMADTLGRLGPERRGTAVRLDLSRLEALDTVGALLLNRLAARLEAEGHRVTVDPIRPEHAALFAAVREADRAPPAVLEQDHPIRAMVERLGRTTVEALTEARDLLNFLGLMTLTFLRLARTPWRIRFRAVVFHIEQTGLNALPILGLLTFLIGVVLAYQGADQLRRFGADIYVVNLLGVSVLREIGTLMTAIIVAGRSGSAFTAQIGTMKVNQEVDAIATLGLDVMELLVVPRALALMISLPLMCFFADMMGLLGGAVMSYFVLDITFAQFVKQLYAAVGVNHFLVGMVKAPVFALTIALVGCYEGMKVSGSAESVGRLTTKAVVSSIFLVIIIDALFSILFSLLKV